MNQQPQNQKSGAMTYIFLIIILVAGGIAYFYFMGNQGSGSIGLEVVDTSKQAAGIRVLNLLNEISGIEINDKIFGDNAYQLLRDNTVSIPALPIGRANPFAPVPGMVTTLPSAGSGR